MGRIVMVLGLTILFVGWLIYRLWKGDLKEHRGTFIIGCTFISIWLILYFTLFT